MNSLPALDPNVVLGQYQQRISERADYLLARRLDRIHRDADRIFVVLLALQWVAGIAAALFISPRAWAGTTGYIHIHVWLAIFLGGALSSLPLFFAVYAPGTVMTRQVIAVSQMLWSALLIHLTGGRIETHFHVFGSLAFLAFYRDWRVLATATVVVAADHALRGAFLPQSVYGILAAPWWRFLEHAGWVLFEDVVLLLSIRQTLMEKRISATHQAQMEESREKIEEKVGARTAELNSLYEENQLLLASIPSVLISFDRYARVAQWNRAAAQLFGLRPEDALGMSLPQVAVLSDNKQLSGCIEKCLASRRAAEVGEFAFKRPGGVSTILAVAITPIVERKGGIGGALLLGTDITDHRNLARQLAQAQKLESVGQLAAGVAHEINTPIQYIGDNITFLREAFGELQTAINAYLAILAAQKDGGSAPTVVDEAEKTLKNVDLDYLAREIPQAIEQSLDGVQRVAKIVRAMKEFSHPDDEAKTPTDLNKAIESTITVARNEWKYVADMVTNLDPRLPLVPCFPGEINQVVLNLIVNAAHAIGERNGNDSNVKGVITVSTHDAGGAVEVRVKDTGTGIPEAIRSKIFDPFFTTKAVGKGSGQGLAIAHAVIVKKHGGSLTFGTETGKGTTFIIRLPLNVEVAISRNEDVNRDSAITREAVHAALT